GGEKGSVLSVRISPDLRRRLATAARRNRRKLSREVEGRLEFSFGRYGTGRSTHIANLAELVALLAQSVERITRGEGDRNRATRAWLIKAFTELVNLYSNATVTPSSVSIPSESVRREDPATMAVSEVIISLLGSSWEHSSEIYGLGGGGVLSKIQRNLERNSERRRRKK